MPADNDGLKSAYELAMERLAARDGPSQTLSDSQKADIAAVERDLQAKLAELEILRKDRLDKARASEDPEQITKAEAQISEDIRRAHAQAESKKERIRARS